MRSHTRNAALLPRWTATCAATMPPMLSPWMISLVVPLCLKRCSATTTASRLHLSGEGTPLESANPR